MTQKFRDTEKKSAAILAFSAPGTSGNFGIAVCISCPAARFLFSCPQNSLGPDIRTGRFRNTEQQLQRCFFGVLKLELLILSNFRALEEPRGQRLEQATPIGEEAGFAPAKCV